MSINPQLAEHLARIARLQELLGFDKFRAISNERAARVVEGHPADFASLAQDRPALLAIDGIGPKIADKIIEFCTTGFIKELVELTSQVPAGLLPLLDVQGLGPKTVRMLWQEGGVTDAVSLKKIIDDGTILTLPRMGEKSVQKIKESLAMLDEGVKRLALGRALPVAEAFVAHLKKLSVVEQIAFAGSLRRGKDTIGDIDILVATRTPAEVSEAFRAMPQVRHVLVAGETRSSVKAALRATIGNPMGDGTDGAASTEPTIQVDLRVVPAESWGAAIMYFTGSKEHNVRLRERALKMGMTLNEYGLFPEDGEKEPPHKRGIKAFASKTEEEVYAKLGLAWVPPELREDRGEVGVFEIERMKETEPAKQVDDATTVKKGRSAGKTIKSTSTGSTPTRSSVSGGADLSVSSRAAPPVLIELADVKAELHSHTTASDGVMSIIELAAHAKARGFHTIAVTDHSKSSAIANGLSVERLLKHIDAIREADAQMKGITILAGSEVDILADGSLDYDDEILASLDVVVASPHTSLSQDPKTATARLLKAVRHPLVHILGHPTGRLINKRPGLSPDFAEIFAAAIEHNVAMEVNSHWMRLDLRDLHVKAALDTGKGCLVAIDCDVHEPGDFDNLRYGITTARRGWLTTEKCVNAWDAPRLHEWLKSKRTSASPSA